MTKEAINIDTILAAVIFRRVYKNGVLQSETHQINYGRHFVDFKPLAVTSPLRIDKTRAPTNWTRFGGTMTGVRGTWIDEIVDGATVYKYVYAGQLAAPGLSPGSIPLINTEGEITAIRKALGRFGEAEVQLGAAMKEAQQTAGMVKKYYDHANTGVKKLESAAAGSKKVRQQFKEFFKNGWKDVPGAYLEYLFGMKPIADDLANAVQVLHDKKQHDGSFKLTLRGKYKDTTTRNENSYQSWVPDVTQVKGLQDLKQISKASLTFQLPDWYWDRLPPVTFFRESWETTRLSFVLDWVLPVNQWLMGFEGNQLRPFFTEGSRSTLMKRNLSSPTTTDPRWVPYASTGWGHDYSYSRVAFDSLPTGELIMRLPRFQNILGLDQLQVGSALLGQRLASLASTLARS